MTETPTPLPAPAPRPSRNWVAPTIAIIGSVAVASAAYYGYVTQQQINQQLLQQLTALQTAQHAAPAITPEQLASLQAIPTMADAVSKLPAALAEQSTAISARLDTLEKTTTQASKTSPRDSKLLQQFLNLKLTINQGHAFADALAALSNHPEITEAMTPLAEMAETGIKPDAALRAQLRTLLDDYHEKNPVLTHETTAPHSLIARLNSQFSGMLHISKRTAIPATMTNVATLQTHLEATAPLAVLTQDVQALSAPAQPYFAAWINTAIARQKADTILAQLEAALASPTGAQ